MASDRNRADEVARAIGERVRAAWDELARDGSPDEQISFADALLDSAIDYASEAYLSAEEAGIPLTVRDDEPRPIVARGRRVRVPRFGPHASDSPVDVAVRVVRRDLGIPRDADTAQIAAAVAAMDARDNAFTAVRKCIAGAVAAAREATAEGVRMPWLAWLFSAAANHAAWALARRQGAYVYGRRAPHAWARAVELVKAADPATDTRAGLRLILAARDQSEHGAEWEEVFERVYEATKQALGRKRNGSLH